MNNKIKQTINWWKQFNGNDVVFNTTNKKFLLSINSLSLPHLLGLQYSYRDPRLVSGGKILKDLKHKNDQEIYELIKINNFKMLENVKNRINTFEYFMKNLENAILVENTNPKTKIKSQHFFIEVKDNDYLHLGLLTASYGQILNEYGEVDKKELETYFRRADNKYFHKAKIEERIEKIERYEDDKLVPFSFDDNKRKKLNEVMKISDKYDYHQALEKDIEEIKKELSKKDKVAEGDPFEESDPFATEEKQEEGMTI